MEAAIAMVGSEVMIGRAKRVIVDEATGQVQGVEVEGHGLIPTDTVVVTMGKSAVRYKWG